MGSVAQQMQAPFREVVEPLPNSVGEWVILYQPGTDDPTGTIKIRLGSIEDARHLEQNIQGSIVVIGGRRVGIQVSNPVLLHGPGNC